MPTQRAVNDPNFKLVTIGFKQALNYAFIVQNPLSSAQIFEYLPQVLSYAFSDVDASQIIVSKLVPYSSVQVDYMITVAEVYFDDSLSDDLQNAILNKASKIYSSPNDTVKAMSALIDPKIPVNDLLDSLNEATLQQSNGSGGSGSSSSSQNEDLVYSLGSLDSNALSASTVAVVKKSNKKYVIGIVVGCVAGIVVYVACIIALLKNRIRKAAINLDNNNNNNNSDDDFSLLSEDAYYYGNNMKQEKTSNYSESKGDVRLSDSESEKEVKPHLTKSLSHIFDFVKLKHEEPKTIPEISAPINVKSSLGW